MTLNHLRFYRNQKGYSLVKLAELSNVPKSNIADYENDRVEPGLYKAFAIANALKVSVFKIWPNVK